MVTTSLGSGTMCFLHKDGDRREYQVSISPERVSSILVITLWAEKAVP